jgi:peptide/nickel transport system permease protein
MSAKHPTFWQVVWKQFLQHRLGVVALIVVFLFVLVGIYAPLLASSKPLAIEFQGRWYFPLFRYLFYPGFFSKRLDIFYNLLMFTFPLFVFAWIGLRNSQQMRRWVLTGIVFLQFSLFLFLILYPPRDPAVSPALNRQRQGQLQLELQADRLAPFLSHPILPNWQRELSFLTPYAKLNLVLRYRQYKVQQKRLQIYEHDYLAQAQRRGQSKVVFPSLWNLTYQQEKDDEERQQQIIHPLKSHYAQAKILTALLRQSCQSGGGHLLSSMSPWIACDFLNKLSRPDQPALLKAKETVDNYERAQAKLKFLKDRRAWLDIQVTQINHEIMPLVRPFHWEDDAGGDQGLNRFVSWWDLTRINRKDMVAALIFGVRVSLSVGLLAIGLALLIGIPIGAFSGYYGGKLDLIAYRLIEIWESMPTFFMLLMIVAFLQSKSIFLIIAVIGFFGWTGFSRFIRGEFFRQKQLLYVEACRALGYSDGTIIFSHLLPNAIPPLLTLVPFAIMGAITSEAGLSFLGLGEEGSNSWGVLMDEGRSAFPSESYLLWPPAILLTLLLVSIALVGDSMRDALDPKLHIH